MRKIISIIFALLAAVAMSFAQEKTPLGAEEQEKLVAGMTEAHRDIKSMSSGFTQTKVSPLFTEPAVQKGKFEYSAPESLVWEYTWPTSLKLDMNNGANKMSMMLKNMIINAITGASLVDSKNFRITYSRNADSSYSVDLKPVSKRMRAMYENLVLTLDPQTLYATSVRFDEAGGDVTTIVFENQKVVK